jgi:hypothetical protein
MPNMDFIFDNDQAQIYMHIMGSGSSSTNQFGSGFGLIADPDPEHEHRINLYIISRVDPPADELVQRHRYTEKFFFSEKKDGIKGVVNADIF